VALSHPSSSNETSPSTSGFLNTLADKLAINQLLEQLIDFRCEKLGSDLDRALQVILEHDYSIVEPDILNTLSIPEDGSVRVKDFLEALKNATKKMNLMCPFEISEAELAIETEEILLDRARVHLGRRDEKIHQPRINKSKEEPWKYFFTINKDNGKLVLPAVDTSELLGDDYAIFSQTLEKAHLAVWREWYLDTGHLTLKSPEPVVKGDPLPEQEDDSSPISDREDEFKNSELSAVDANMDNLSVVNDLIEALTTLDREVAHLKIKDRLEHPLMINLFILMEEAFKMRFFQYNKNDVANTVLTDAKFRKKGQKLITPLLSQFGKNRTSLGVYHLIQFLFKVFRSERNQLWRAYLDLIKNTPFEIRIFKSYSTFKSLAKHGYINFNSVAKFNRALTTFDRKVLNITRTPYQEMKFFKELESRLKSQDWTVFEDLLAFNKEANQILGNPLAKKFMIARYKEIIASYKSNSDNLKKLGFNPNSVTLADLESLTANVWHQLKITRSIDPLSFLLAIRGAYYHSANRNFSDSWVKTKESIKQGKKVYNYYYELPNNFFTTVINYSRENGTESALGESPMLTLNKWVEEANQSLDLLYGED
jgi:hypothetical protein